MKIIYTTHAKLRMIEMAIPDLLIHRALLNPDQVIASSGGTQKYIKKLSSQTLEVICALEYDRVIIITAYYY